MSIRLMAAVWVLPVKPAPKLVLLALADWADDAGGSCFPSIRSIAARASVSERQAQRHMRGLDRAGWVNVSGAEAGGATSRRYRLAATRMYAALAEIEAAKSGDSGNTSVTGDIHVTRGVTHKARRGDTSVTRSTNIHHVLASSSTRTSEVCARPRVCEEVNAAALGGAGKQYSQRVSGIVTWYPEGHPRDDTAAAAAIEAEYNADAIRQACRVVWARGKDPVPGLVRRECERLQRERSRAHALDRNAQARADAARESEAHRERRMAAAAEALATIKRKLDGGVA